MKKLIALLLSVSAIVAITSTSTSVEAQPFLVGRCCDSGGYPRCFINPTPIGNACFCYSQGWGTACY